MFKIRNKILDKSLFLILINSISSIIDNELPEVQFY